MRYPSDADSHMPVRQVRGPPVAILRLCTDLYSRRDSGAVNHDGRKKTAQRVHVTKRSRPASGRSNAIELTTRTETLGGHRRASDPSGGLSSATSLVSAVPLVQHGTIEIISVNSLDQKRHKFGVRQAEQKVRKTSDRLCQLAARTRAQARCGVPRDASRTGAAGRSTGNKLMRAAYAES